jgi:hypothetical protein
VRGVSSWCAWLREQVLLVTLTFSRGSGSLTGLGTTEVVSVLADPHGPGRGHLRQRNITPASMKFQSVMY